jgi:hypothetical protein
VNAIAFVFFAFVVAWPITFARFSTLPTSDAEARRFPFSRGDQSRDHLCANVHTHARATVNARCKAGARVPIIQRETFALAVLSARVTRSL